MLFIKTNLCHRFQRDNMNDFTKEELFEILGLASKAYGTKGRTMPIIVKLQSMIDNYCEHDFHPVLGSFQIESCHKCMKVK